MNLLITTQKVDINDDVLGFFHSWIKEFAKRSERVTVICLEKGEYDLPENVEVVSLGKQKTENRKQKTGEKLKFLINFYRYIWQRRKEYDAVFVHMNPEYVVLGGLLWRLMGKRVGLWYLHREVTWRLRLAEFLTQIVFSASRESFRLKSKKIKIVGHGIDLNRFQTDEFKNRIKDKPFNIIYVGRISRIKNQKLLLKAVDILVNKDGLKNIKVQLIGEAGTENDQKYREDLIDFTREKKLENYIEFVGSVPNIGIAQYYHRADLSINLCPTGGMDKAVLESMVCGTPVIVLNQTFFDVFLDYREMLVIANEDEGELAEKIKAIMNLDKESELVMKKDLARIIKDRYSLDSLINRVVEELK